MAWIGPVPNTIGWLLHTAAAVGNSDDDFGAHDSSKLCDLALLAVAVAAVALSLSIFVSQMVFNDSFVVR